MNNYETINKREACRLILSNQLPLINKNFKNRKDLFKIIQRLGYLQIDTISIVERSHHHILWSRMPSYKHKMLDELVEKDKLVFEYWSHAAAYLPINSYRYTLIRKRNFERRSKEWASANSKIIKMVLDRIKTEGPLMSRNFSDKSQGTSGWWNWKPSKEALDYLFHAGKLMIAKREGFQKVYDITERVLPENTNEVIPSEYEFYRYLILSAIEANGIVSESEIMYLRKYDKSIFKRAIDELTEEKIILRVKIHQAENKDYYSTEKNLLSLNKFKPDNKIHILSPFDNLIIQRKRLKDLFNFDYQIECYVPEEKRKYGYFCLPVLYKDRFIGRMDAKSNKGQNTFQINKLFFEGKQNNGKDLLKKIKLTSVELAEFTGCKIIKGL